MKDFTILLVATNKYVDYALDLIPSIINNLFHDGTGQVVIFTDSPLLFGGLGDSRVSILPIEIPNYGWPEATLYRYKFFEENWSVIQGNIVMYMDVDTLVVDKISISEIVFDTNKELNNTYMVRHPGYFHNNFFKFLLARSPLGTWETNRRSTAFVPFFRRTTYVAGGVWLGLNSDIHKMVKQLNKNVTQDSRWGYIAKWHDESHLNWWAANNKINYLSPAWAHAPGYRNIKYIIPRIQLVHKPQEYFDQR